MKKLYALLLALCLMLSLAACGSTPAPATSSETPQPAAEAPAAETPAAEPAATEEPESAAPETEEPAAEEPQAEAPAQDGIRGTLLEDAYENAPLNLRIARPAGWIFYSDEQIAQVNNVTAELMSGTDVADYLNKNGQFMDMIMADAVGNSLNLLLQPRQAALDLYSDEQIFTLSENTFRAQFSAAGMEISTFEPLTMQVGGQERTVLHMVLAGDTEVDEYQIWYRTEADFMGILTLAIVDGSDAQPILDGITALN